MKLTGKRLLVASVVAVAVIGVAWLTFAENENGQPPFGVTRSAYHEIHLGMTIEDVERIIGEPAFNSSQLIALLSMSDEHQADDRLRSEFSSSREWHDDGHSIGVLLNQDGLVWRKCFFSWNESLVARLLRQLRSIWGRLGF